MLQVGAVAFELDRQSAARLRSQFFDPLKAPLFADGPGKDLNDDVEVPDADRFIESDDNAFGVVLSEVHRRIVRFTQQAIHIFGADIDSNRIEVCRVQLPETQAGEGVFQSGSEAVDAGSNRLEAFGPVIDGVHRGHDRQQSLRRTDVGGRFIPTDVLLAGLQGKAVGVASLSIDRDSDQATGHGALEFAARRKKSGVGAAKTDGHAESLGVADDDIHAPLSGRRQQSQRQQVRRRGDSQTPPATAFHELAIIVNLSILGRVLNQGAKVTVDRIKILKVAGDDINAQWFGAAAQDVDRMHKTSI